MSLATTTTTTTSPSPALSVDELEAKLVALHDFLSTPYRTRAEAILEQRRRREGRCGDPSTPAITTRTTTTALSENKDGPRHTAGLLPFSISAGGDSSYAARETTAAGRGSQLPSRRVGCVDVVESPARSLFPDGASRAGQSREEAATATKTSTTTVRKESYDDVPFRLHAAEAAAGAYTDATIDNPRIERLQWQVEMLVEALRGERERFAEVQQRVVRPLEALVETSVRRQAELESELALWKAGAQPR